MLSIVLQLVGIVCRDLSYKTFDALVALLNLLVQVKAPEQAKSQQANHTSHQSLNQPFFVGEFLLEFFHSLFRIDRITILVVFNDAFINFTHLFSII